MLAAVSWCWCRYAHVDILIAGTDPSEARAESLGRDRFAFADDFSVGRPAGLLEFLDDGVAAGDLYGKGPGLLAGWRLLAFRNRIEASGDLIERGWTGKACLQLEFARRRTDGEFSPPDFVAGPWSCGLGVELALVLPALAWLRRGRGRLPTA